MSGHGMGAPGARTAARQALQIVYAAAAATRQQDHGQTQGLRMTCLT